MSSTKATTQTTGNNKVLWLLALVMFLVVLDSAIINVALPAIKATMHFNDASLQWVVTGYVLTFGGFLMLGGRTADLFGRRRVLVMGVAGFTLFSLMAGLATNSTMLIAARALQGVAGAFMAPAALSILLATFEEGPPRNRALSIWSLVASGGAAAGVFLGGLLTQYLGWRWCFFVNVPIGIIAIYYLMQHVPAHIQEESDKNLDVPGAVLITSGLMTLVYALSLTPQIGWTNPGTLVSLGVSAGLLGLFVWNETRVKHPLVPLSIFRLRNVTGGNLVMLPVVAGALGMFFFVSLFIQNVLGYSPSLTGLASYWDLARVQRLTIINPNSPVTLAADGSYLSEDVPTGMMVTARVETYIKNGAMQQHICVDGHLRLGSPRHDAQRSYYALVGWYDQLRNGAKNNCVKVAVQIPDQPSVAGARPQ